jgi:hypothetical protein
LISDESLWKESSQAPVKWCCYLSLEVMKVDRLSDFPVANFHLLLVLEILVWTKLVTQNWCSDSAQNIERHNCETFVQLCLRGISRFDIEQDSSAMIIQSKWFWISLVQVMRSVFFFHLFISGSDRICANRAKINNCWLGDVQHW